MSLDREHAEKKKLRENYLDELNFYTEQHRSIKKNDQLYRQAELMGNLNQRLERKRHDDLSDATP